jgi:hypothetical protein
MPDKIWTFDPQTTMTKAVDPYVLYGGNQWKGGSERGAFAWELARHHPDAPTLPPYPRIPDLLKFELTHLFGKRECAPTDEKESWTMKFRPGYSMPCIWPLEVPDSELVRRFKRFIAEQRAEWGVVPKQGQGYESSQGPRWRWVELLDLARNRVRAKSTLAHGRDFDKRCYKKARARSEAVWRKLEAIGIPRLYFGKKKAAQTQRFIAVLLTPGGVSSPLAE